MQALRSTRFWTREEGAAASLVMKLFQFLSNFTCSLLSTNCAGDKHSWKSESENFREYFSESSAALSQQIELVLSMVITLKVVKGGENNM